MKRKIQSLGLIPFYALIIAAGLRAGGSSHQACSECNRAIGKRIKTVVEPRSGEQIYVVQDSLYNNTPDVNGSSVKITSIP